MKPTQTEHSDRVACTEQYRAMSIAAVTVVNGRRRPGVRVWFGACPGGVAARIHSGHAARIDSGGAARIHSGHAARIDSGGAARCGGSGWPAGIAKQENFKVLTVSATLPSAAP